MHGNVDVKGNRMKRKCFFWEEKLNSCLHLATRIVMFISAFFLDLVK